VNTSGTLSRVPAGLPLFLTHPRLLWFDLRANRRRPDLQALRAEHDPEAFVWKVLPHAARSFALSILCLSHAHARTSALAYLQCRMLDTVEDLTLDPSERLVTLERMAHRLRLGHELVPPAHWKRQDARDDVHLLLIERSREIDALTLALPQRERELILSLVEEMACGMLRTEAARGPQGAFPDDEALVDYCDVVIGSPLRFCARLFLSEDARGAQRVEAAWPHIPRASAFLQLANISRDLEKDLARGVVHVPEMVELLDGADEARRLSVISAARARLSRLALGFSADFDAAARAVAPRWATPSAMAARVMRRATLRHHRRMLARSAASAE
jgi:phytoene/squalene synthetase